MDLAPDSHIGLPALRFLRLNRGFQVYAAAILLLGVLTVGVAVTTLAGQWGHAIYPGWNWRSRAGIFLVSGVSAGGPAQRLRLGDQMMALNGRHIGPLGPGPMLREIPPGQNYTVTVKRGAEVLPVSLSMGVDTAGDIDAARALATVLLLFFSGVWIWLAKPSNVTAQLGSLAFLTGGIALAGAIPLAYPANNALMAWLSAALSRAVRPLQMALGWDFFSRFPQPVPEATALRLLRRFFYAVAVLAWVASNIPVYAKFSSFPPWVSQLIEDFGWNGAFSSNVSAWFEIAIPAATIGVLIRNFRLLGDWDSRKRIVWAAVSFGTAALSVFSLRALELGFDVTGSACFAPAIKIADIIATVSVASVPVALAFTVVKHHILDIRLALRSGAQYLLAKNALRLILLAPVLIILFQTVRHPERSIEDLILHNTWGFYLLVMSTAALSLRYRQEMTNWLDRRFFRTALKEEEIWGELSQRISAASSADEIAKVVGQHLHTALAVDEVHVFFREPTDGSVRIAFSYALKNALAIRDLLTKPTGVLVDRSATVVAIMQKTGSSWPSAADPESDLLLVVPLMRADAENLGALVLGPKKSEEPYSHRERQLIQAIAGQMVMACEVMRLQGSVDKESKQRVLVLGRFERERIQLLQECPKCGDCYDASRKRCPRDASELELTLPVERVIDQRYRLDHRLGAGAMGVVFEATDLRLGKSVAVKVITSELFGNQAALARFRREAQVVASLRHPNIVGVHDFGRLPMGGAFLVMDLLRGISWRRHLREASVLQPQRAARWIEDLCAGAAAAHGADIVHRDLKPENVMIVNDGDGESAVILDFGLAKLQRARDGDARISAAGAVVGTRTYMSPEQRMGGLIDTRSDIFSIGVIALETLARSDPPRTGPTEEWIGKSLSRISERNGKLVKLFTKTLSEEPALRFGDAIEFGLQLSEAILLEARGAIVPESPSGDSDTLSFGAPA